MVPDPDRRADAEALDELVRASAITTGGQAPRLIAKSARQNASSHS